MTDDPFVAIGGDAAGLSAASKAKREDPDREVVVLERGQWTSFAHCGTPYYVKGDVEGLDDLVSLTPADIADRGIVLRRDHAAVAIDTDRQVVTVEGPDGTIDQSYGDLLIGTGARAVDGPFDTAAHGAFTLHGLDDAAAIRAYLAAPGAVDPDALDERVARARVARAVDRDPPGAAAIVGGGYVGVEMAEALAANDVEVHLFQRSGHVLPPFGDAVGERVVDHLRAHDVHVHLDTPVEELRTADGQATGVTVGDGSDGSAIVDAELVLVGIGVRPNVDLAREAGIELGESGAIATDEYGRTNAPHVYAAGDCAEATHAVTGAPEWVPLGLTANRAGRAIGTTVVGEPTPVGTTAGTAVVKAFDLGTGRTGLLDPDRAREAGFEPVGETITAGSRSGYYPGAAETTVTMVADRSSRRVLGASTVGEDRAAKRIDTVATAIDAGLTADECERLDLGYAPPFSPVWDPVLVAAKVLSRSLDDVS